VEEIVVVVEEDLDEEVIEAIEEVTEVIEVIEEVIEVVVVVVVVAEEIVVKKKVEKVNGYLLLSLED
jgi:hypothetical protein